MDFVDLTAFGVGMNFDDNDIYKDEVNKINKNITRYCNKYGNLLSRLETFDEHLNQVARQLVCLGERFDERIK